MKRTTNRSLVLHSGGIDSTILASFLKDEGKDLTSLYFNVGHNAAACELSAVRATSGMLDIRTDVIDLSSIRSAFVSSAEALMVAVPNPGKHVLELGSLLLLGPAITYARRMCIDTIYVGYTKLDADFSSEYSIDFLRAISLLSSKAGFEPISIEAPFISDSKESVLKRGSKRLEVLAKTWSCVLDGDIHCGTCQACRSRKEAFSSAGIEDPTRYRKT